MKKKWEIEVENILDEFDLQKGVKTSFMHHLGQYDCGMDILTTDKIEPRINSVSDVVSIRDEDFLKLRGVGPKQLQFLHWVQKYILIQIERSKNE